MMSAMSDVFKVGMALSQNLYRTACGSEDAKEIPCAFAEKHKLMWKGR